VQRDIGDPLADVVSAHECDAMVRGQKSARRTGSTCRTPHPIVSGDALSGITPVCCSRAHRAQRHSSITTLRANVNSHARTDSLGCCRTSGLRESRSSDSCTTSTAKGLSPLVSRST
jgi:hypothetical protein